MVICQYAGYKNLGSCGVSLKIFKSFLKMGATPPPPPLNPSQVISDQSFSMVCFNPATLIGIKSHSRIPLQLQDGVILGSPNFSSSVELVCSQLVCLQMGFLLVILTTICFLLFFLWARNANCWNTSIIMSPKST